MLLRDHSKSARKQCFTNRWQCQATGSTNAEIWQWDKNQDWLVRRSNTVKRHDE